MKCHDSAHSSKIIFGYVRSFDPFPCPRNLKFGIEVDWKLTIFIEICGSSWIVVDYNIGDLHEITNMKIRQSLTKFRLSNNTLDIEKLRHTTPITLKEQRFCPFCPEDVEDEVHFLIQCPTYQFLRFDMFQNIDKPHLFLQKTPIEQFIELMNHENAQIVAKTVNKLFDIRDFLFSKPKRRI